MFAIKLPRLSLKCSAMKAAKLRNVSIALAFSAVSTAAFSADLATLQKLPLFSLGGVEYIGGFRYPEGIFGESEIAYSEGPIAVGRNGSTMYAVGHTYQQAVGEFQIPSLVKSMNVADFNRATVTQGFSRVLHRPASGNPQQMDRIGGMAYVNGQLLVNTYVYYDATASATHTTLVVKDAAKLSTSSVGGYYSYSARAHATGWISPVPLDWQSVLGGTYIAGDSSGKAIISRLSVGPSAFVFDPTNPVMGNLSPSAISLTKLLDYDLDHPIGMAAGANVENYLYNSNRSNLLWTHMSRGLYGFIVPGTRTYLVVGYNGGMTSGIGYKITPSNGDGQACGGYCAYDANDYSNYYWMFDMNDLLKVKSGQMASYQVMPYSYGKLNVPYANSGYNPIIGGTFDNTQNVLYLSLERGDTTSFSSTAPSVVAFKINTPVQAPIVASPPSPPSGARVQVISP